MTRTVAFVLILVMGATAVPAAQGDSVSRTPLRESIAREAARLGKMTVEWRAVQPQSRHHGWFARHPVAAGALIGLGSGMVIGAATCSVPFGDQGSCSDFTYPGRKRNAAALYWGAIGAGVGASIGAVVAAALR